jgi:hypothetical protein
LTFACVPVGRDFEIWHLGLFLEVFFFEGFDLFNSPFVPATRKRGIQPHFDDLLCQFSAHQPTSDHQDIGIGVFPAASGGVKIIC